MYTYTEIVYFHDESLSKKFVKLPYIFVYIISNSYTWYIHKY